MASQKRARTRKPSSVAGACSPAETTASYYGRKRREAAAEALRGTFREWLEAAADGAPWPSARVEAMQRMVTTSPSWIGPIEHLLTSDATKDTVRAEDLGRLARRAGLPWGEALGMTLEDFVAAVRAGRGRGKAAGGGRAPEGAWSAPLSLREIGNRLGNIGGHKVKAFLGHKAQETGVEVLKQAGSRQSWQVRVDVLDDNTRNKLETGRPLKK